MPPCERLHLVQVPGLAGAIASGVIASGYRHFLQYGLGEGRIPIPTWNESSYLAANPDIAAAVQARRMASGFRHYWLFGRFENRPVSPSAS